MVFRIYFNTEFLLFNVKFNTFGSPSCILNHLRWSLLRWILQCICSTRLCKYLDYTQPQLLYFVPLFTFAFSTSYLLCAAEERKIFGTRNKHTSHIFAIKVTHTQKLHPILQFYYLIAECEWFMNFPLIVEHTRVTVCYVCW